MERCSRDSPRGVVHRLPPEHRGVHPHLAWRRMARALSSRRDVGLGYRRLLCGDLVGKHPLLPSISPKKTVEGVLGGLVLAVGVAFLAQQWFTSELSLADAVILGVLLTIAGLLGDLFESMIKRRTGVKDSGGILPGHGGMLDRLDSLLFTAPTFYYYVAYVRSVSPPS